MCMLNGVVPKTGWMDDRRVFVLQVLYEGLGNEMFRSGSVKAP